MVTVDACIVSGCTDEFLLGVDFMQGHGATMDFDRNEVRYREDGRVIVIPFRTGDGASNARVAAVRMVRKMHIAGSSVVPVEVSVTAKDGEVGVFVPTCSTGAVMLAATVTTAKNGRALVPAINSNSKEARLPSKKELGTWVPLDEKMTILSMNDELDMNRVGQWLDELGDSVTPLDDEDEVRIGEDDPNARTLMLKLLRVYRNLTASTGDCPPATAMNVYHHIDTGDTTPIMLKRRRQAQIEDGIVEENVDKMLKAGVIEEGDGAWGFPVVLVRKKDGEVRFCVDYRALNKVTKKDVYPLPRIDETLEALGGALLFSTLDLTAGYWQIMMAPNDRDKTAFTTKKGLYRFVRMPFGLTNAPSTFQRLMNSVLRGLTWTTCLVYLDDIVIFTRGGIERHVVELATVLERLSAAGLTLKLKKCMFATRSMEYLGHELSGEGVRPLERLVTAVRDFPRPTDATEVKRFVHIAGYYRRFVPGFGTMMAPLTKLLRKDVNWEWCESQNAAFETVKQVLTTKPLLRYPNFQLPFRVVTDASHVGLGACLIQDGGDGWRPIAYASKVNSPTESKYGITELECLAVVWAIKLFRPYLYGRRFTIVTDHAALKWLMTSPNLTGKLHRWAITLQEFDFDVQYRPGNTNVVADALSRAPVVSTTLAAVGRRQSSRRRAMAGSVAPAKDSETTIGTGGATDSSVVEATAARSMATSESKISRAEAAQSTTSTGVCATKEGGGNETKLTTKAVTEESRARPFTRAAKRRAEEEQLRTTAAARGAETQYETGVTPDASRQDDDGQERRRPGPERQDPVRRQQTTVQSRSGGQRRQDRREATARQTPMLPRTRATHETNAATASVTTQPTPVERTTKKSRTGTATSSDDEQRCMGPTRGKDDTHWSTETTRTARHGAARRGEGRQDKARRSANSETLQLTDDEITRAQSESRLVQRLVESGEHRGRRVTTKHGLVVIETTGGNRVVLPPRLWAVVFKESHDSVWAGHLRAPHTYARVAQTYWWPNLHEHVKQWVRGCQECGSRKARPREVVPPLRSIRGGDVGDRWALDVAGPLPDSDGGQRFVIAAVEYVTRYAVAATVKQHTAENVASFLMKQIVLRFGPFRELLTDGAPELTGKIIEQLVLLLQAEQVNPVPYRPQMIGLVERFHRTWKDVVATYMNDETQRDWDTWIDFALYAYNSGRHSTVLLSPNELMMGRRLRGPNELLRRMNVSEAGALTTYHQRLLRAMESSRKCAEQAREKEQHRQAKVLRPGSAE